MQSAKMPQSHQRLPSRPMFPYSDNLQRSGQVAGVSLIIALLIAADLPALFDSALYTTVIDHLGFIPLQFSVAPWANVHRLISSVFLHSDAFHVAGNCLFLWVFGRSLQRLFGTTVFLLLFPFLGIVGLLLHWIIYPQSRAPVIGASGAIATLMGTYLALFPKARIKLVLLLGTLPAPLTAPAWVFLLYWGGFELLSLVFGSGEADRVAYAVHVGGFIAGIMAAIVWKVAYPFAEERLLEFTSNAFQK
jgi:membrane associated rhomboid family serine protease